MPDTGVIRICNRRFAQQEFNLTRGHAGLELRYNIGINPVTLRNIEPVNTGRRCYN